MTDPTSGFPTPEAPPSPAADSPARPEGLAVRLWDFAANPVVFVYLAILWSIDLGVGSVMAHQKDPRFWMRMDALPFNKWLGTVAPKTFPESLWVYVLAVLTCLMVLSLAVCTANWFFRRRRRMRGVAEMTVHLGFLLVFAGFFLGAGWGSREQSISLETGGSAALSTLPYALRLDGVDVIRDEAGGEFDMVNRVSLLHPDGSVAAEGVSRVNHPLIHGDVVVYPQGNARQAASLTVEVGGVGRVILSNGKSAELPDGRSLLMRFLPPGRRFDRYAGPGFLLGVKTAKGGHGSIGFLPPEPGSRAMGLEGLDVSLVSITDIVTAEFNVHRDPGVWFVLAGAAILLLGTVWALGGYLVRPPPAPFRSEPPREEDANSPSAPPAAPGGETAVE